MIAGASLFTDYIKECRRMYLHLYYSAEKAVEDGRRFNIRMIALQQELLSGKRKPEQEKDYGKYFEVKHTPLGIITPLHSIDLTYSQAGVRDNGICHGSGSKPTWVSKINDE